MTNASGWSFPAKSPGKTYGGSMSQFRLLLHESPADYADISAAEMQRIIGEYIAC
jgi:hypothetical protein